MRGVAIAILLTLATSWPASVAAADAAAEQSVQVAALSLEGLENPQPPDEAPDEAPEAEPPADLDLPAIEESPEEESPEEETPEEESPEGETVRPYAPLRSHNACPTDTETLSSALIRDIPGYTNRVMQRTVAVLRDGVREASQREAFQGNREASPENRPSDTPQEDTLQEDTLQDNLQPEALTRSAYRPSYVLVAGSLELAPLDLSEYTFTTTPESGGPLTQVFFTTLSRQYSGLRFDEVQEYHWLFLAPADDGWWLAFMFSSIDDADTARAPLPPRENSRGSVGQAVQLWLRDCRAGTIEPLE
jgi:hypothetical protein